MKKLVLLIACTVIATSAFAQGTINFTNLKPSKQIINDADGNKLTGGFAQLYAGKSADSLSAVGKPVDFYDGVRSGYFSGGVVDVGFNGAGFFQVKAWQGADNYESALISGASNVIGLTPGDSTTSPPGLPTDLAGLESFSLVVIPEPGTIALAVLGLAAFFVRRRK